MSAYFIFRITNNLRFGYDRYGNERWEEIADDEPFMSTTHIQALNDRSHSYHVDRNSFAGLLPRHDAVIHDRRVEIGDVILNRKILEVRFKGLTINIEIGATVDTPRSYGRVLQAAIYGDVRLCSEVVRGQTPGTYEYTGAHKAVKLIRKSMLSEDRVENPLTEIAATQFIHDRFVRPSLHHDIHYY